MPSNTKSNQPRPPAPPATAGPFRLTPASTTSTVSVATATADDAVADAGVRTPWGRVRLAGGDADVRDPFEPDAPLSPAEAAAAAARRPGGRGAAPTPPRCRRGSCTRC
jgi:hypothetical protein